MLRIQRVYNTEKVLISLNKKDSFLSSSLQFALFLSLLYHLLWAALFSTAFSHPKPAKITPITCIVTVDKSCFLDQENTQQHCRSYPAAPPIILPQLHHPKKPLTPLVLESTCFQKTSLPSQKPPTYSTEKEFFTNHFSPTPFSITISGPLQQTLQTPKLPEKCFFSNTEQKCLCFSVLVSRKKGNICWWSTKNTFSSEQMASETEQFLEKIQFIPDLSLGEPEELVQGVIEVYIK